MLKNKKIANVKSLDTKLKKYPIQRRPKKGWVNNIRRILNMSLKQLGKRLHMSGQGVYALENREAEEKITVKKLQEVAKAFDMDLFYIFSPRDSLERFVDKKALQKAKEIVRRSHQNMVLENQQIDKNTLNREVKELANAIKASLNSQLWD